MPVILLKFCKIPKKQKMNSLLQIVKVNETVTSDTLKCDCHTVGDQHTQANHKLITVTITVQLSRVIGLS